ncbi:MAG: triphosphoribosyl-dephospho-CoA synthase CitG [Hyphomicrobiales bacterium]|nr:triphosphoribosyl-dephospho-CoA synthase CitG [Hyphomicrobiales bacterium]
MPHVSPPSPERGSPPPAPEPQRIHRLAVALADLVADALLVEVATTPKPGLVDLRNTGSHRDMDVATFHASASALRPLFPAFFEVGVDCVGLKAVEALERLRTVGLTCERAMFAATGGVNTHKGSIFSFGLLLGAAGRVWASTRRLDIDAVCDEVATIAAGVVARELDRPGEVRTAGERLHRLYGLTGARGEAESGFATVRRGSLPVFERALVAGLGLDDALRTAFLHLLAHNDDTNIAARGGIDGLAWAKAAATALVRAGGADRLDFIERMEALDDAFIERNLSPGGSADLLAMTWVLHCIGSPRVRR